MINSLSLLSTVSLSSQCSKSTETKSPNYELLQNFGIADTIKDYMQIHMTSHYLFDSLEVNRENREFDLSESSQEINSLNSALPSTEDKADALKYESSQEERKMKGKTLKEKRRLKLFRIYYKSPCMEKSKYKIVHTCSYPKCKRTLHQVDGSKLIWTNT